MPLALISTNPPAILQTWPSDGPVFINVPGLWQLQGATAGWQSPDGTYKLVAVLAFIVPNGQVTVGSPTYSIAQAGTVTQTFQTQAAPLPGVPQLISDRQFYQQLAIQGLCTQAEALAAVSNGTLPAALATLVAGMPTAQQFGAQMLLSGATQFIRSNPLVAMLGTAFGWTSVQLDALWTAANAL